MCFLPTARAGAVMLVDMVALIAQTLGPAQQDYLLEARQLQALSFAVHIPLVCFGVALPALVVYAEWLGRRRADAQLAPLVAAGGGRGPRRAAPRLALLARRWSKTVLALFAVGVVTGTILSFELGM